MATRCLATGTSAPSPGAAACWPSTASGALTARPGESRGAAWEAAVATGRRPAWPRAVAGRPAASGRRLRGGRHRPELERAGPGRAARAPAEEPVRNPALPGGHGEGERRGRHGSSARPGSQLSRGRWTPRTGEQASMRGEWSPELLTALAPIAQPAARRDHHRHRGERLQGRLDEGCRLARLAARGRSEDGTTWTTSGWPASGSATSSDAR